MNIKDGFIVAAGLTLAMSAMVTPARGDDHDHGEQSAAGAEVRFFDTNGEAVGHATLSQGPNGLLIDLSIAGLSPGGKAIHLHQKGDCSDSADGFVASGGHINPDGRSHGLMNADGPDAGDLPNFFVGTAGQARAQFFTSRASLDGEIGARLLDDDGAAMIIHENVDDHRSQPIGGAGSRVACGLIEG